MPEPPNDKKEPLKISKVLSAQIETVQENRALRINRFSGATLSPLYEYVGKSGFEDELSKVRIEPQNKRLVILPDAGTKFILADTHGKKEDLFKPLGAIIKQWLSKDESKRDCYLIVDGDFGHGLKIRNTEKKGEYLPLYTDNSIENLAVLFKLKELVGDRLQLTIGDHELPLLFDGFKIYKYGDDLSTTISRQLTDEENIALKNKISSLPFAVFANGKAITHAGAIPALENIAEAEKVHFDYDEKNSKSKFRAPPRPNEENYEEKMLLWYNETILGQATMGKIERVVVHKIGNNNEETTEERLIRIISKKDNRTFMKNTGLDGIISGHSGLAEKIREDIDISGKKHVEKTNVYVEKEGKKVYVGRMYTAPVIKMEPIHGQVILVTTEGDGYEKARDGKENEYGAWFAIDDDRSTIQMGEIGRKLEHRKVFDQFFYEETSEPSVKNIEQAPLKKKSVQKIKQEPTKRKDKLYKEVIKTVDSQFIDYGSIPYEFYHKFRDINCVKLKSGIERGDKRAIIDANNMLKLEENKKDDFKNMKERKKFLEGILSKEALNYFTKVL